MFILCHVHFRIPQFCVLVIFQVHEAQVHADGKEQSVTTNSEVKGCGQDTNLIDHGSKVAQKDEIDKTKARSVQITLVVVDGTWEHAQEMVKASLPFLSQFVVQVCLPFDKHSEGDGMGDSDLIMRKEPFGGCVSTMEAVARSLAFLEADGHIIEEKLMAVLRKMVLLQASHFGLPKIRPKLKKKSKRMDTDPHMPLAKMSGEC